MYRQASEHVYSHPPQHQGAMIHDEPSLARNSFLSTYPTPSAFPRPNSELDPSYYHLPPPTSKQQAIYGPSLAQQQQQQQPAQQMASQRPIHSRPIPPSHFQDDPAFSPDPRSNPLANYTTFAMNSREEIVPTAGNQAYVSSSNSWGTAPKRDPSAIYAYPPAPPIPSTPAPSGYHPASILLYPSAASHISRLPSDDDSFYGGHSFTSSAPSHNGSFSRDPRGSNDASSVRLAYDEPEERVVPPEPSPNARRSYYGKYADEEDEPPRPAEQSGKKLHKAKHADKDRKLASQASLASSANTSYSSHKSSSASSFARAQSGDVSLASSRSKASLRVANPDPYAIFMPQHTPDMSASSIDSSSEGPHTPPSAHGHLDPNASFGSRGEKGYMDDKALRRAKSKEAALAHDEHEHGHHHAAEAPPAYTPLPTPTETLAAAGPSRSHDSKVEYSTGAVQVTLTPDGMSVDPLQPSTSQASAASSSSSKKKRRGAESEFERPPLSQGNASSPELHVPPQREVPVRATTAPIPAPAPAGAATTSTFGSTPSTAPSAANASATAPPMARTRSRKPSVATPPKDLDKIDELDESDPLGVAWHMPGPYDAIPKVAKIIQAEFSSGEGGQPKIFAAQAGGQNGQASLGGIGAAAMNGHRKPLALDPSTTSFAVKPGQIFPPIAHPTHAPHHHTAPVAPQAPFSPTVRQAYMNNHMVPGSARPEPPPPVFSPTPSEMAREQSTARDPRRHAREQREREREEAALGAPNLSGVGTAYAGTMSEGHSTGGGAGFASFAGSASGHSSGHGAPPPPQMQREQHMHQQYPQQQPQYQQPQYQQQHQHGVLHRPHLNPIQPAQGAAPEHQLKPQSSRSTLSRSRSAPNTTPPSSAPSSSSSSHSRPQQMLSTEPPPTPDIQLPPPPQPAPASVHSVPPPPGSTRSGGAPSVRSSATARSQMPPPANRYMPKQLVMPTPLQPMQPLPGAQPQPAAPPSTAGQTGQAGHAPGGAGYAGSAASKSGYKGGQGAPLKHSQTVPARGARPQAQAIPMSAGKNVLRKQKENGGREAEGMGRSRSARGDVSVAGASVARTESRSARGDGGATAVWAGRVVVVPEEKKKSGGIGALFGFGGSNSREKEREKEKERVLAERARERERDREREREREKRKLSKARR